MNAEDIDRALLLGHAVGFAYERYAAKHGGAARNLFSGVQIPAGYEHVAEVIADDGVTKDIFGNLFGKEILLGMPAFLLHAITKPIAEIFASKNDVIVAFRGTDGYLESLHDADVISSRIGDFLLFKNIQYSGIAHSGFLGLYSTCMIDAASPPRLFLADFIHGMIGERTLSIAGHSLGAALATLFAIDFAHKHPEAKIRVITFASPRVGDPEFVRDYNARVPETWRIDNEPDFVPDIPFCGWNYDHVQTEWHIDSRGTTKFESAAFHDLRTYLHMIAPDRAELPAEHKPG